MFFVLLPTHVCLPSVLQDFSSKMEKRESFLHICNSVFEVLYRISETCTNASGLNLPALRTTKDDANHHWLSMCSQSEVCFVFNMSHDYSKIAKRVLVKYTVWPKESKSQNITVWKQWE